MPRTHQWILHSHFLYSPFQNHLTSNSLRVEMLCSRQWLNHSCWQNREQASLLYNPRQQNGQSVTDSQCFLQFWWCFDCWLIERSPSLLGGPIVSLTPLLLTQLFAPTAEEGRQHPVLLLTTCFWALWKEIRGSGACFLAMGKYMFMSQPGEFGNISACNETEAMFTTIN